MKNYPIEAQKNIVLTCYVLHNFIRKIKSYDQYFMDSNAASNMDAGDAERAQVTRCQNRYMIRNNCGMQ